MSLIEVTNLKFRYTDMELYNNINFRLLDNEHAVLLGNNGVGKSTFLKILAKILKPDFGKVEYRNNIKISYLDQHLKVNEDIIVKEYLYGPFKELYKKEEYLNNLYKELEHNYNDKLLNTINNIQEELLNIGFYDIDVKINNVLIGLGINFNLDKSFKNLSGGQRVKVFLAKMLLEEPDVMLMDEPTNFLDVEHIEWLKKFLINYKGSFLVVSHYFEFVNEISNVIYELDNKEITKYKGNLDFYLKEREIRKEDYIKRFKFQQSFIKKTEDFIDKNITRASTTKRAQSRRKLLEKLDVLDKPQDDIKVTIKFKFTKQSYLDILEVNNLAIGYNNIILNNINFNLKRNDKVCIVGRNGLGKTTLIKTLLNIIPKKGGNFKFSESCDIVYFSQDFNDDENITPFNYILYFYPYMDKKDIYSHLNLLGINYKLANSKINTLSGGEKSKVRLAKITLNKGNTLILDEPTNHLDKNSKNELLKVLIEYPGNIILVSHDKDFYEKICNKIIKL